jgi:thiosulfate/3-mercaptopyruvate sulfurtransferase
MGSAYARPELIASADWVAEHLGRSGVRLVDCRWRPDGSGRRAYAEGHVPGAVYLDWAADLVEPDDTSPFRLAGPDRVAAALAAAGIGDGMTAILYDDGASLHSARTWWSLQAYGFASVRILDGGWRSWLSSGRPSSSASPRLETATFTPRAEPARRLSTADVEALLASASVQIVDARATADFLGHQGGPRLGHVPGAVSLPAVLLTESITQRFLPAADLDRVLADAGVRRGVRIVTYDASGIGAAKAAFALELAGCRDVAVYEAGWLEWASKPDLPVER